MKAISKYDGTSPDESRISKGNADAGTSNDTVSLAAEPARLREELKYQRLRADAYDEMINVAEEQFDIKIRKKAGAKQ
jgi:hypothetical protein